MRTLLVVAMVGSIAAAASCGSSGGRPSAPPPPWNRPAVSLTNVHLNGVGLMGGSLDLELNVFNSNAYELHQPRVTYRVLVDNSELGSGIHDADITVGAADSVTVRLPMSFTYAGMGQAGRALMNTGAVTFRVLGYITVTTPHGRYRFPYDRVGRFATLSAGLPR